MAFAQIQRQQTHFKINVGQQQIQIPKNQSLRLPVHLISKGSISLETVMEMEEAVIMMMTIIMITQVMEVQIKKTTILEVN